MSVLSYHVYSRLNPHVHTPDAEVGRMFDEYAAAKLRRPPGMSPGDFITAVEGLRADVLTDHTDARDLFVAMRF